MDYGRNGWRALLYEINAPIARAFSFARWRRPEPG